MARTCSYSKRDLQLACSKTKRKIQNDIEMNKIIISMATKTYVYSEVGKRLKLKDTSTFHKKSYKYYEYLNTWFEGLTQYLEENIKDGEDVNINISNNNDSLAPSDCDSDIVKDLRLKLCEKDSLIKTP